MWLTRISVNNPVFATMMMASLLVVGLFAYFKLSIEQFPDVEFPIVVISTSYPGATPESVESEVTRPIEDAVNTISGVRSLTSRSLEGSSLVIIEFELTVDPIEAVQDVREKVATVTPKFRDEVKDPEISRFSPDSQPIASIAVRSDRRDLRTLTTLADQVILKRLQTVRGVGRAYIVGGLKRRINILPNPEKMQAYGIDMNQLIETLETENQQLPVGTLTQARSEYVVQIEGRVADPAKLSELIVARRGGAPVYLGDVAEVQDGSEEQEAIALYNGEQLLIIEFIKVQGANTLQVIEGLKEATAELERDLPSDIKLQFLRDDSRSILISVNGTQRTLIEGAILTILIIYLFLNSWRSTIITGLTLPIAVIGTLAAVWAAGFTLNKLTLMALSLAIGILIDDAIVVRENITRHAAMGKGHRRAALEGTSEIGLAVLATTFTIVAVFLPVAFMEGIIGRFFLQFGITVTVAVLISLFVSFTLDPMLSSVWHDPDSLPNAKRGPIGRVVGLVDKGMERLAKIYRAVLHWSLRWRWAVLVIAFVSFVGSFGILASGKIGTEFLPDPDLSEILVEVTTPPGSSLDYTKAKMQQVQAALKELPEVEYSVAAINAGGFARRNVGTVYVRFVPLEQRTRTPMEMAQPIRDRLWQIAGIDNINIGLPNLGGGLNKPIMISIQGQDIAELDRLSREAMDIIRTVPGVVDLESSLKANKPTVAIEIDRQLAADLGVSLASIAATLRPLLAGEEAGTWKAPDSEDYDVFVRLPQDDRTGMPDLERIYVASTQVNADGNPKMVALSQVVKIAPSAGSTQINRRDLAREVLLTAATSGRTVGEASREIQAKLEQMKMPPGYRFWFGGASKDMKESFGYAMAALLLAVIFIYLILASQFASFLQPFAIMASLPLSLIGVIVGLWAWGSTLNIFSMIGFIMLMGLVTKNAILLIDFVNHARRDGLSRFDAILEAGEIRLRPIIMTTLAMIFGMIPLALALGEGAKQTSAMAHAVIGGLISSTLLTLIVTPVIFTYLDDLGHFVKRFLPKAPEDEPEPEAPIKQAAE
ncbi:efflux RND transporter permease subunit [uncultured Ferrovibrio sp.]|jgi:HAE1 family hydrophobic/amphiphilic exporter-1|uniref:efflux RND transporter permease subunit n=1 Tax=uncultured Ferrovibrio sp. TaxID=1576913 RepID=UPI002621A93E|nr:efflux RND transporter permease subunit [uncultured Ferrovibrio sp.]